jgi:5-methylcytosine-specific restriction protein A
VGTFILTWNPDNWHWTDLAAASEQTERGTAYHTRWSTGNTRRIQPGDRLFLLKQGQQPRGVIAAGWATSDVYSAPHWNPQRAEQGEEALRVDVDFARILDPQRFQPLATDTLSGRLASVHWAMPASGFELPADAAQQLETAWEEHVEAVDEPADDEYARNPPWQRDELILALDLYFRHPPSGIGKTHPELIALSELLNALPIHADRPDAEKFRNPNGVYMKMCNFLRFDPSYQGKGLERGNRLEREVWDTFADDRALLAQVAAAIRAGHSAIEAAAETVEEEEAFPEGRVLFRLHSARERNRNLVKRAKALAIQRHGRLTCCICQFDFAARYGSIGEGFIECHHTSPLSELAAVTATRVSDLALVCANCHRMIHRKRPWLTMNQLARLLRG